MASFAADAMVYHKRKIRFLFTGNFPSRNTKKRCPCCKRCFPSAFFAAFDIASAHTIYSALNFDFILHLKRVLVK